MKVLLRFVAQIVISHRFGALSLFNPVYTQHYAFIGHLLC